MEISMVGRMCSWEASGAASVDPIGVAEECITTDGYSGISTDGVAAGACNDGRNSRSGTCPPPYWKGAIGTNPLAFDQLL